MLSSFLVRKMLIESKEIKVLKFLILNGENKFSLTCLENDRFVQVSVQR